MLLSCLTSCTRCLLPRRAADSEQGPAAISVPEPAEAAAGATRAPASAAESVADHPELPFQTELELFTGLCATETETVTVDYSMPVNVMAKSRLQALGYELQEPEMPLELKKLAGEAALECCGWQVVNLSTSPGNNVSTRETTFVIVADENNKYGCDVLLGREFKDIELKSKAGLYPIFPDSKRSLSKEERERQARVKTERDALAAQEAAEFWRLEALRLERSRNKDLSSGVPQAEGAQHEANVPPEHGSSGVADAAETG